MDHVLLDLRDALRDLADASEALVGADPQLSNYADTEATYEDALAHARVVLARTEGR